MGRMLSSNERRGNVFSTPLAGLESRRYVTGPISTGTVSIPSYTWAKRKAAVRCSKCRL
jgi:hypothetical protein